MTKFKIWNFEIWISFVIWILMFGFFCFGSAEAKPPKGFHEGPYFMLSGGAFYYTADNNARTGEKTAGDFEPVVGFNFGWNLKDYLAPELQVKYSTNKTIGTREHIVSVNLNTVLTFVTDQLTDIKSVKILPFLQGGVMAQFAALPGDPLSDDKTIPLWGPGISVAGGIKFLFLRYGYAGFLIQSDFVYLPDKKQNIAGVNSTIIEGGWNIQPSFLGLAGVHF